MANISDAFGTVSIWAESLEDIKRILSAHEKGQEIAYFETTITNEFSEIRTNTPASHETVSGTVYELPGAISVKFDFTGSGRWNFMSNVKWFIDEILEADPSLKNTAFGAVFEFSDADPGFDFIYNSVMQTEYAPDTGVKTSILEESDEVEYSANNLIEYGFYDEGEIFDFPWLLENKSETLDCVGTLKVSGRTTDDQESKIDFILKHPIDFFDFVRNLDYSMVDPDLEWLLLSLLDDFDVKDYLLGTLENIETATDIFEWMNNHRINPINDDTYVGSLIDNHVVWLTHDLSTILNADALVFEEKFLNEWSSAYELSLLSEDQVENLYFVKETEEFEEMENN